MNLGDGLVSSNPILSSSEQFLLCRAEQIAGSVEIEPDNFKKV
jgi:hypothetical protein